MVSDQFAWSEAVFCLQPTLLSQLLCHPRHLQRGHLLIPAGLCSAYPGSLGPCHVLTLMFELDCRYSETEKALSVSITVLSLRKPLSAVRSSSLFLWRRRRSCWSRCWTGRYKASNPLDQMDSNLQPEISVWTRILMVHEWHDWCYSMETEKTHPDLYLNFCVLILDY